MELPCTVRTFSESAGVGVAQVMKALATLGTMLTINARIPDEMVELLISELGLELQISSRNRRKKNWPANSARRTRRKTCNRGRRS